MSARDSTGGFGEDPELANADEGPGAAYLRLLPGPYQGAYHGPRGERVDTRFLGHYLKIFEQILTAESPPDSISPRSMARLLDVLPDMLYPGFHFLAPPGTPVEEAVPDFFLDFDLHTRSARNSDAAAKSGTPESPYANGAAPASVFASYLRVPEPFPDWLEELLEWVATWIGLVLHRNWSLRKKRVVIARILPLYRKRGTRAGLEDLLELYFERKIKIIDDSPARGFRPGGKAGRIGARRERRPLGGFPRYYFIAAVALKLTDLPRAHRLIESIRAVIEREKPIHVNYNLAVRWPPGAPGRFVLSRAKLGIDSRL